MPFMQMDSTVWHGQKGLIIQVGHKSFGINELARRRWMPWIVGGIHVVGVSVIEGDIHLSDLVPQTECQDIPCRGLLRNAGYHEFNSLLLTPTAEGEN